MRIDLPERHQMATADSRPDRRGGCAAPTTRQYSRKATVTSIESSDSSDSSSIATTAISSPRVSAATSSAPSSIRHCATEANYRQPDGRADLLLTERFAASPPEAVTDDGGMSVAS